MVEVNGEGYCAISNLASVDCGSEFLEDMGPQSLKCNLHEVLIYALCQVDMLCFPHVLVCVHQGVAHIIDSIEDNGGNARHCAHPHGVSVRLYMCVCGKVLFASYFSCQQSYVKSLTVSNGLVNFRALKCM